MEVRRGELSAVFDGNGTFLRRIALGGEELFRGIGFVARDKDWGTPELVATPQAEAAGGALRLTSSGELATPNGRLVWRVAWTIGEATIEAEAAWSSPTGFVTNRTGLVVLHSLDACRGRPVRVTHPDGSTEDAAFPALVSPHQPFFDIAGLDYETAAGARLRLTFAGETFEIEDQRNWTDASYKTYCRPLRLPFPYRIAPGAEHRQSLRLTIEPPAVRPATRASPMPEIGAPVAMPLLGTTVPPGPASAADHDAVRRLDLPLLALELDAADADIEAHMRAKLAMPFRSLRLDLRPAERAVLLAALARLRPQLDGRPILGVTLWGADDALIAAAQDMLPGVPIGAGSAATFVDLNRTQTLPSLARYLSFPSHPTVHGFTDDTIGETTEPLEDLVATYGAHAGGIDLHVGPLTLGARFNAVATTPEGRRRGAPADPRQGLAIAAAWTLGSLIGLLAPVTRTLTVFEPFGAKGLVAGPDMLTPAARVLQSLAPLAGAAVRPVRWRESPRARGLLREEDGMARLWIAHAEAGPARIPLPPGFWRIEAAETDGATPPRVEGGSLMVDGFSALRLTIETAAA